MRLQIVGRLGQIRSDCLLFALLRALFAFAEHITTGWLNLILLIALRCCPLLAVTKSNRFTRVISNMRSPCVCCCAYCFCALWVALGCLPLCALRLSHSSAFEQRNNDRYVAYAKAKLDKIKGVKIAITGSYGKTSVKNILCSILQTKYLVGCSPRNFNTPLGIARWVSSDDFDGKDVYIFEMGARRKGDIINLWT